MNDKRNASDKKAKPEEKVLNLDIDQLSAMLQGDVENNKLEEMLNQVMNGHTSIQAAAGISNEQLEVLYSLAYNQYAVNKYEMAIKVFGILCVINPYTHKYWMGLGASLQMAEYYDKAAEAYGMATATLDRDDPNPCFNAGECYIALGNTGDALAAFRLAHRYSHDNPAFQSLKARTTQIIKVLESNSKRQATQEVTMA